MKRKFCAAAALVLALVLLSGCSGIDLSWFTSKFKTESQLEQEAAGNEPESPDSSESSELQGTAVATEVYSELERFGLAYQPSYGLDPYNCQSLCNRVIFSFLYVYYFLLFFQIPFVHII